MLVCKKGVTVIVRVVFGVAVGGTSGVNSVVGCCLCEGWMPMQLIDAYLGLFGSVLSSVCGGAVAISSCFARFPAKSLGKDRDFFICIFFFRQL